MYANYRKLHVCKLQKNDQIQLNLTITCILHAACNSSQHVLRLGLGPECSHFVPHRRATKVQIKTFTGQTCDAIHTNTHQPLSDRLCFVPCQWHGASVVSRPRLSRRRTTQMCSRLTRNCNILVPFTLGTAAVVPVVITDMARDTAPAGPSS